MIYWQKYYILWYQYFKVILHFYSWEQVEAQVQCPFLLCCKVLMCFFLCWYAWGLWAVCFLLIEQVTTHRMIVTHVYVNGSQIHVKSRLHPALPHSGIFSKLLWETQKDKILLSVSSITLGKLTDQIKYHYSCNSSRSTCRIRYIPHHQTHPHPNTEPEYVCTENLCLNIICLTIASHVILYITVPERSR